MGMRLAQDMRLCRCFLLPCLLLRVHYWHSVSLPIFLKIAMQTVTAARSQDSSAGLACPRCGHVHHLDIQAPDKDKRMSTVLCSCGETFLVVLDARQFERKTVAIKGMYTVMNDSGLGGLVSLRDLSEGGVGFALSRPCELQPGWLITVVFELAGKEKRVIIAKATIRSVQGMDVGCAFVDPEQVRQDILAYFES